MRRIILTYGLIAGAITGLMLFVTIPLYKDGTFHISNGQYVGYTTMLIALSMIFFGVKRHRDQNLNGIISFGNALGIGLLITLVAAIIYAFAWEICIKTMAQDFMDMYITQYMDDLRSKGATAEKLAAVESEMAMMKEWYKNPVLRFGMTMIEILPVGLIVSLISAFILKRKAIQADIV